MGWSSINSGMDWQAQTFVKQFAEAINERDAVLGGGGVTVPSVDDDIQAVSFWANFQNWVVNHCASFVRSYSGGAAMTGGQGGDYDQVDNPPENYDDITDLLQRVTGDNNVTHFRRFTSWPPAGGGDWADYSATPDGYGSIENGDIIGPWIFQDLQKALNGLRWTKSGVNISDGPTYRGHSFGDNRQDAIDGALADWGYQWDEATLWAQNYMNHDENIEGDEYYEAVTDRRTFKLDASNVYAGIKRAIDWIVYIEKASHNEFRSFGDPVANNKYCIMQSDSPAENDTNPESANYMIDASDNSGMDDYSDFPDPPLYTIATWGWYSDISGHTVCALIRWDITDGFDYKE